jgi:hypothetical protein
MRLTVTQERPSLSLETHYAARNLDAAIKTDFSSSVGEKTKFENRPIESTW